MNGNPAKRAAKKIIVDSSSLITISDNCMIKVMKNLSLRENISFIIPESVYFESVLHPLQIKKYELNAVRIKDAVEDGYLTVAKNTGTTREIAEKLGKITATLLAANGTELRLMQRGECETLALIHETGAEILLIDERTTRMLIENPAGLAGMLSQRHKCNVAIDNEKMKWFSDYFKGVKVIRSVELIALAYEGNAFGNELHRSRQALEAALYAAKYSGCAVSENEIIEYMKRAGN